MKFLNALWEFKYTKPFVDVLLDDERGIDINDLFSEFEMRFGNENFDDSILFSESLKILLVNNKKIRDNLTDYSNIINLCLSSFEQSSIVNFRGKPTNKLTDPSILFYGDITYRESISSTLSHINKSKMGNYIPKNINNMDGDILFKVTRQLVNKQHLEQNYLFLVEGEIGSGKTTFLTRITMEAMKANRIRNLIVIKIDFEDHINKLIQYYNQQIKEKEIEEFFRKTIEDESIQYKDKKNPQIIIILDNLDIIYQKFCEQYFITGYKIKFIDYLNILIKVIKNYKINDKHIIVYFALRKESSYIMQANISTEKGDLKYKEKFDYPHNKSKFYSDIDIAVTINELKPPLIKEVIRKRLKLAEFILKSIGTNDDVLKTVNSNIMLFENTKINFEELHNVSTEGLRHTISLFTDISLALLDEVMFKRFFIESNYIKKLHFLGKDLFYSQVNKGIFNIFLNNSKYRKEWCEDDNERNLLDFPNELEKLATMQHFQTYWLKYLILLYLYIDKKDKKITSYKDIIKFFVRNGSTQKYEENIVRLVLLGLSEVTHGRILDIKTRTNDSVYGFQVSKRGEYILENIIWSFDYLAVILEDKWLPIPNYIRENEPDFFTKVDGYCLENTEESFNNRRIEVFKKKVKKVWIFLRILEVSYKYEHKKVDTILSKLIEKIDKSRGHEILFRLPRFNEIKKALLIEMNLKAVEIGLKEDDASTIVDELDVEKYSVTEKDFFKKNFFLSNLDDLLKKQYFYENERQIREIYQSNT